MSEKSVIAVHNCKSRVKECSIDIHRAEIPHWRHLNQFIETFLDHSDVPEATQPLGIGLGMSTAMSSDVWNAKNNYRVLTRLQ